MNLAKLGARIMVLAIVGFAVCASSQPASASTGSYNYNPCTAAQAAINYLASLDEQIEAFAAQYPTNSQIQAEAAFYEEQVNKLISDIEARFGSTCKLTDPSDD